MPVVARARTELRPCRSDGTEPQLVRGVPQQAIPAGVVVIVLTGCGMGQRVPLHLPPRQWR
jgi:hypothetical protein